MEAGYRYKELKGQDNKGYSMKVQKINVTSHLE